MFSGLLDHISLYNILLLHTYLLTYCNIVPLNSVPTSHMLPISTHSSREATGLALRQMLCQFTLISSPTAQLIDLKRRKQHMSPAR